MILRKDLGRQGIAQGGKSRAEKGAEEEKSNQTNRRTSRTRTLEDARGHDNGVRPSDRPLGASSSKSTRGEPFVQI